MSYSFDGSTQWIGNVAASFSSSIPYTLACWFLSNNVGIATTLVQLSDSTGNESFQLRTGTSAQMLAGVTAGGTTNNASSANSLLSTGIWYHGCAVFSSSTLRTVYLNGAGVGTDTTSRTPTGTFTRLHIGSRRASSANTAFFNGRISDVGIWNAELTTDQILSLSKGVSCRLIRPQNLVFYTSLVRELIDTSNNLTLTNNSGATVSDHTRIYI
jgi:hypothetical protein